MYSSVFNEQMIASLHVVGNHLENTAGDEVWLQGVSIASMEWLDGGEYIPESFNEAISNWNVNCIRLPIRDDFWFGQHKCQYFLKINRHRIIFKLFVVALCFNGSSQCFLG